VIARPTSTQRLGARRGVFVGRENPASIVEQLDGLERAGAEGTLSFGARSTLHVSSLDKPFFAEDGLTKGDVMRYYASIAQVLLPIIKDRPLILHRFPNGIEGESFFQQNAGATIPAGVRTAKVATSSRGKATRLIGGDLLTLLYTVQIGTIAVHSWQARVQSQHFADTTTIDLDPGDNVAFRDVVALARAIKAELDTLNLHGAVKTSGSSGLHIALPLPPQTSFDRAGRVAQAIAERIVQSNPRLATLERSIAARPAGSIYVDAQQNAEGKSVVAAYSVRARRGATVSAPLEWTELRTTLRIDTFNLSTMLDRVRKVGDVWGAAMKRRNLKRALDRLLSDHE
jgi:bifunctional non-homologous end joining protein LigD